MIKIKSSLKKDVVFDCIDYNINIDSRTMYYSDEIDLYSPAWRKSRIEAIYALTGDNKSPVTLEITSYGGDEVATPCTNNGLLHMKRAEINMCNLLGLFQ